MTKLENISPDYYPVLFNWFCSESYKTFILGGTEYKSIEHTGRLLEWRVRNNYWIQPQIIVSDKMGAIGFVYGYEYSKHSRRLAITTYIHKPYERFGFGVRATSRYVYDIFYNLNLHKVYLEVLDSNKHSRDIMIKEGFGREAYLKEHRFVNGKMEDVILFAMYKHDVDRFSRFALKPS
jgi:RimJ/RimL family protein N-acetyltransferase